jgi:hypothetical protein
MGLPAYLIPVVETMPIRLTPPYLSAATIESMDYDLLNRRDFFLMQCHPVQMSKEDEEVCCFCLEIMRVSAEPEDIDGIMTITDAVAVGNKKCSHVYHRGCLMRYLALSHTIGPQKLRPYPPMPVDDRCPMRCCKWFTKYDTANEARVFKPVIESLIKGGYDHPPRANLPADGHARMRPWIVLTMCIVVYAAFKHPDFQHLSTDKRTLEWANVALSVAYYCSVKVWRYCALRGQKTGDAFEAWVAQSAYSLFHDDTVTTGVCQAFGHTEIDHAVKGVDFPAVDISEADVQHFLQNMRSKWGE